MVLTGKRIEIHQVLTELEQGIDLCLKKDKKSEERSHLQNYVFFTYKPVFNYTEAIFYLSEQGKHNAASVLLRCVIEAYINMAYHKCGDIEKKLAISAKKSREELRKAFSGMNNIIKNYPQMVNPARKFLQPRNLEDAVEKLTSEIHVIESSNSLLVEEKELDLLQKAKKCDEMGGKNDGHFAMIYQLIYRQLSSMVHLDCNGLDAFVKKTSNDAYVPRECYADDTIVVNAAQACLFVAKSLIEVGLVDNSVSSHTERLAHLVA